MFGCRQRKFGVVLEKRELMEVEWFIMVDNKRYCSH
jgi:hypothetical protein